MVANGRLSLGAELSMSNPIGSQYDNVERSAGLIKAGRHRNLIGGKWDEIGQLQLDFLINAGMKPDHKLLDIGCGCLRAGVKIIPYLDPFNYFGIDREKQLLDVGFNVELKNAGIRERLIRENLYTSSLFKHGRLPDGIIDFGICNSVMTHLPQNFIRICLENTEPYFKIGGKLFITFFELPEDFRFADQYVNAEGVVTNGHKDNYHYYASDMLGAAAGTGWTPRYIGEWEHPRGQNIIEYTRVVNLRPKRKQEPTKVAQDTELALEGDGT